MNDDELRMLIRAAIQRQMGSEAGSTAATIRLKPDAPLPVSISFGQYRLERAADDTMCIIEPAVQCNHCGYCLSYGH